MCMAVAAACAQPAIASSISGRVWDDLNRDGIQDPGEPGISSVEVQLARSAVFPAIATNTTDIAGGYSFPVPSNGNYQVWLSIPPKYGLSPSDAGDDTVDSDFDFFFSDVLTFNGTAISNVDAGLYQLVPGIMMITTANGVTNGTTLNVTNGAVVHLVHSVTNSGEVTLSQIFIYNPDLEDFIDIAGCPILFPPGSTFTYATQKVITVSRTNYAEVIGFPVIVLTCGDIPGLDPVWQPNYSAIVVVTNDPIEFDDGDELPNWWESRFHLDPLNASALNANSDSDWMTDLEEYYADTDPTNSASYLPPALISNFAVIVTATSTQRVYNVWSSTNIAEPSPSWSLLPPEQTGSGGAITFGVSNEPPFGAFRTGVRLP